MCMIWFCQLEENTMTPMFCQITIPLSCSWLQRSGVACGMHSQCIQQHPQLRVQRTEQVGRLYGRSHSCKFAYHFCLDSLFWMSWENQLSGKPFRVLSHNQYELPKIFAYTYWNTSVRALVRDRARTLVVSALNDQSEVRPHASLD